MNKDIIKFIFYSIGLFILIFFILLFSNFFYHADDTVPEGYSFNEELTKQLKILGYNFITEHNDGSFELKLDENIALYNGEFTWKVYTKNNSNKAIYFSYWRNPTGNENTFFWHNNGEYNIKNGIVQYVSIGGGIPESNYWTYNESLTQMYSKNASEINGSIFYIYKGPPDYGNLSRFHVAYFEGNESSSDPTHITKYGLANNEEFLVWYDV